MCSILPHCRLLTPQYFQNCLRVDGEACRRLTRRIFLEGLNKLCSGDDSLNQQVIIVDKPIVVLIRSDVGALVRIHAEVV